MKMSKMLMSQMDQDERLIQEQRGREHLRAEIAMYRKMLYDMTSLIDWMRAGYPESLYNEIREEHEVLDDDDE